MNWHIYVRKKAEKQLKRFPAKYSEKIELVIDELRANPYSGDVQKMRGEENTWRRRVGPYRIKFEVYEDGKSVYIFDIERRTSNTY